MEGYKTGNFELIDGGYVDDVIVSDKQLSLDTGFVYVPLGSHRGLGAPGAISDKYWDIIHLSCYSNHRGFLFNTPDNPKSIIGDLTVAPSGWGEFRDIGLRKTRFMLSIHQDAFQYSEPLRITLAAAYGLPVIAEEFGRLEHLYKYVVLCQADPMSVIRTVRGMYLHGYERWYEIGMEFRNLLTTDMSFRNCLEKYLC